MFTIVAAKNENTVGSYPIVVKAIATLGAATTTKSVSFTLDVLKFTSEDSPYTINMPPFFTEAVPSVITLVASEMLLYEFPATDDTEEDYPIEI